MQVSARITWLESLRFNAELSDGRKVELNSSEQMGHAFTPMELFLFSLAGCTAMDVQWILERQRQKVDKLELSIRGIRREEDPMYYETIDLEYAIRGPNIKKSAVERAIRLSQEKYCPVRAMLKNTVKFNISYKIMSGKEPEEKYVYTPAAAP